MQMKDRVALVTGASRGIGAATARLLAREGAAVGVNWHQSEAPANAVVESIRAAGGRAVAVRGDARDPAQCRAMVEATAKAFGPVDTLVANAAIGFPVKPFVDFEWEAFEAKLTGELAAAFHGCKAVVPSMIERKRGCIVLVSSGLSRRPGAGFVAHCTAKSGLDAFGRSLAFELGAHGIRVNVVAPGLTETDATAWQPAAVKEQIARVTPLGRLAQAEDIAGAILAVAMNEARFLTGLYVGANGGAIML
jgi:3-oxoacyl-[acyl-carrier protein] reductase